MNTLKQLLPLVVVGFAMMAGCVSDTPKKPDQVWTVPEVANWYYNYKRTDANAWDGILYRGSDSKYHRFTARLNVADQWVFINVKREDLKLPETHRYSSSTNAPIGYYFVDPLQNFKKLRDFQQFKQ